MDREIQQRVAPNYKAIYTDILDKKFPEKKDLCKNILSKNNLSVLDIIKLNNIIFNSLNKGEKNKQRHRSYTKGDIFKILDYQKINKLNNSELAKHFGLSRNSVTKWKKKFLL